MLFGVRLSGFAAFVSKCAWQAAVQSSFVDRATSNTSESAQALVHKAVSMDAGRAQA